MAVARIAPECPLSYTKSRKVQASPRPRPAGKPGGRPRTVATRLTALPAAITGGGGRCRSTRSTQQEMPSAHSLLRKAVHEEGFGVWNAPNGGVPLSEVPGIALIPRHP